MSHLVRVLFDCFTDPFFFLYCFCTLYVQKKKKKGNYDIIYFSECPSELWLNVVSSMANARKEELLYVLSLADTLGLLDACFNVLFCFPVKMVNFTLLSNWLFHRFHSLLNLRFGHPIISRKDYP